MCKIKVHTNNTTSANYFEFTRARPVMKVTATLTCFLLRKSRSTLPCVILLSTSGYTEMSRLRSVEQHARFVRPDKVNDS